MHENKELWKQHAELNAKLIDLQQEVIDTEKNFGHEKSRDDIVASVGDMQG